MSAAGANHTLLSRLYISGLLMLISLSPSVAMGAVGVVGTQSEEPVEAGPASVILMRVEDHTVVNIRPSYTGEPQEVMIIFPIPENIDIEEIQAIPISLFDRIDQHGAPRLVEYWETDPCLNSSNRQRAQNSPRRDGRRNNRNQGRQQRDQEAPEAQDETLGINFQMLDPDQAADPYEWLLSEGLQIDALPVQELSPYIDAGWYLYIARIPVSAQQVQDGINLLPPFQYIYQSVSFTLPVRPLLLSAGNEHELVVNILGLNNRYEIEGIENRTLPTNIPLSPEIRSDFSAFFTSLFERHLSVHPDTSITEYAWNVDSCEPCVDSPLDDDVLSRIGTDLVGEIPVEFDRWGMSGLRVYGDGTLDVSLLPEGQLADQENRLEACISRIIGALPPQSGEIEFGIRVMREEDLPQGVDSAATEEPSPSLNRTGHNNDLDTVNENVEEQQRGSSGSEQNRATPGEDSAQEGRRNTGRQRGSSGASRRDRPRQATGQNPRREDRSRETDEGERTPPERITTDFEGGNGIVTDIVISSETIHPRLQGCLDREMRQWRFPKPENGTVAVAGMLYINTPEATIPIETDASERPNPFVLTRLHLLYTKENAPNDLVFVPTSPIAGGREIVTEGRLEQGTKEELSNAFQTRYIIRHPWEEEVECEAPIYGRWNPSLTDPHARLEPVPMPLLDTDSEPMALGIAVLQNMQDLLVLADQVEDDPMGLARREAAFASIEATAEEEEDTPIETPVAAQTQSPSTASPGASEPESGGCTCRTLLSPGVGGWINSLLFYMLLFGMFFLWKQRNGRDDKTDNTNTE